MFCQRAVLPVLFGLGAANRIRTYDPLGTDGGVQFAAAPIFRCKDVARDSQRAPIRIRTEDPFITNEVLYQLSYWGYAPPRLNDETPTCNSN